MSRTPDLFPGLKPARAKPRVMMSGTDHSFCDEEPDSPYMGEMKCKKCGHEAGWMYFKSITECKRGAPCPICNKGATNDQA